MPSAEKKPKTKTVTITLPQGNFPLVFYANRCGIGDADDHKLVYFGFVSEIEKKETTLAEFACIFDRPMIEHQKKDWLDFLRQIGLPAAESKLDWRPSHESFSTIPLVNAAALCRSENNAEIRCFNYSIGDAFAQGKEIGADKVAGQTVALIRCSADLLRHFLLALFDANELL